MQIRSIKKVRNLIDIPNKRTEKIERNLKNCTETLSRTKRHQFLR